MALTLFPKQLAFDLTMDKDPFPDLDLYSEQYQLVVTFEP
jgi:hypothetical protein